MMSGVRVPRRPPDAVRLSSWSPARGVVGSAPSLPMEHKVKIDIGIDPAKREDISRGLSRVLADSYTLYLKTHNYHWNVTGPMFQTLHLMFETQYNELALAVDLVAERIRALGFPAPGTYKQFTKLSIL